MVHHCECRLANMMLPYLEEAAAAGVDLQSGSPGRDSLSLASFDGGPLENHLREAGGSFPEPTAPNQEPEGPPAKRRRFALPAGSGSGWA